MKFGLYTLYDIVSKTGDTVFQSVNDEVAKRSFVQEVKKQNPARMPDLELHKIGEYDSEKMEIVPCEHVLLMSGADK